jgi:release factor glutamine methyltransferase
LVPHPYTFQLIQIAERVIGQGSKIKTIVDVGTGSGVIAICLAKKFPKRTFYTSDISKKALVLAKKNSVLNKVKNIHFLYNSDNIWLSEYGKIKTDFIVSNPPYIGEKEFSHNNFLHNYPEVKLEPKNSVVTLKDESGFSPYLNIIKNSSKTKTKLILFQCNSETIRQLKLKISHLIKCKTDIYKDMDGLERFLLIYK